MQVLFVFLALPELLPWLKLDDFTSACVALAFNVSFTLFSGTAPLIATSLIEKTGNNASPAYMMMAGALIALVGSIWVTRYGGNVMQEA